MVSILAAKKAIIIHSIEDAKYCINNNLLENHFLIATHPTPIVFLREKYSIESILLSSFLDFQEIVSLKKKVDFKMEAILQDLDNSLKMQNFPYKINFFKALYQYLGKHTLLGLYTFEESIKKAIYSLKLKEIIIFDTLPFSLVNNKISLSEIVSRIDVKANFSFLSSSRNNSDTSTSEYSKRIKKIINNYMLLRVYLGKFFDSFSLFVKLYINNKTKYNQSIYIYASLYDLDFIPSHMMKKYNVIYNNYGSLFPIFNQGSKNTNDIYKLEKINVKNEYHGIDTSFIAALIEDFYIKMPMCLQVCNNLQNIVSKAKPSLALWGNPPVCGAKSIAFEFLHSMQVPILGAQHGACYVTQLNPWHYDSDFHRCNYYISYGFDIDDLNSTYPEKIDENVNIKILPYGSLKMVNQKFKIGKKEKIDVLFPLTLNIPMFEGGMSQLLPHVLADRQYKIIKFLESATELISVLKPFMHADFSNCSMLPIFDSLKNVRINNRVTLSEALSIYKPNIIIIEQPSTPLYEILHLDVEIFLMNDNIFPFEYNALNELKKRVHYFEQTEKLLEAVESFFEGKLESKRDNTFLNHYVYKSNTKENILDAIDKIIEGKL